MNLDLTHFLAVFKLSSTIRVVDSFHCVPEVFNKLAKTYTQGHFWLFCMLIPGVYVATDYKLELKVSE